MTPILVVLCVSTGCSDDSTSGDAGSGGAGSGGLGESGASATSGSGGTGGAAVVTFTGDCTTGPWGNVSDECWSCACDACADTLSACDESCVDLMDCALTEPCLVGDPAEIACEVTCVTQVCVGGDAGASDAFAAAAAFDSCLIGSAPSGQFRACEAECGIAYTRDVCAAFPAP